MAKQYWFWIVSKDPESGRPYLIMGGRSEDEARQRGLELLAGLDFRIKKYPTSDLTTASSFLRGKRLEQSHSLAEAGRRQGHEKTIRRRIARRRIT